MRKRKKGGQDERKIRGREASPREKGDEREKQKKIIRKLKEQLLILKTNASNNFQDDIIIVKELEEKILDKIAKYKKYGADNW